MPEDDALEIPVSGETAMAAEVCELPLNDYAHWKNDLFDRRAREADGVGYVLEALRLKFAEGAVGYREALAIRTVGQPGVAQHTDTSKPT